MLYPLLFAKLIDEIVGYHSVVAGRPLQNRPATLIGAEPVPLRKLRTRRLPFEEVNLQRVGEQRNTSLAASGSCGAFHSHDM